MPLKEHTERPSPNQRPSELIFLTDFRALIKRSKVLILVHDVTLFRKIEDHHYARSAFDIPSCLSLYYLDCCHGFP